MKVLFINSKQKQCGVYQYGLRLWRIVKKSFFDVQYHEISEYSEFLKLNFTDVNIIFLNWIEGASTGPFAWFDFHAYDFLKSLDIKVVSVQHTKNCFTTKIDYFISQDPKEGGLIRPLFEYQEVKSNNNLVNIGSFGFAFEHKHFPDVIRLVNEQYDDAIINLNITSAFYGDNDGSELAKVVDECNSVIRKPGIILNLTTDFLSNQDLLNFVNNNDLIVLAYSQPPDISSVVDYVISTGTPLAVTNIPAFRHIYREEIDIRKKSLQDILEFNLKNNFIPKIKEQWSPEKLLEDFEIKLLRIFSCSQIFQDLFVHLLHPERGFFLDIGCGCDASGIYSNTLLLEKKYEWTGILIDGDRNGLSNRINLTKSSKFVCCNIQDTSIKSILRAYNSPKTLDYISIDLSHMSIIALQNFPFDEYEFKILTFEHDSYLHGEEPKKISEDILTSHGYFRLCDNVAVPPEYGNNNYFEDWWINPKFFSEEFLSRNLQKKSSGYQIIRTISKIKENCINYSSRGNFGDLIHQLWVIQQNYFITGKKGNLYLTEEGAGPFCGCFSKGLTEVRDEVQNLLTKQDYINSVEVIDSNVPNPISLSSWRDSTLVHQKSWTEMLVEHYNLDFTEMKPWLKTTEIDERFKDKIIIHESTNTERKFDDFPWRRIIDNNNCVFVTFEDKTYEEFKFKAKVNVYKMKDFEECCLIMNSCKMYIGNLTSVTAIAHAMCVPRLIELNTANLDHIHYVGESKYFDNLWFLTDNYKMNHLDGIENFMNLFC